VRQHISVHLLGSLVSGKGTGIRRVYRFFPQ
jgi:hypothetical protein